MHGARNEVGICPVICCSLYLSGWEEPLPFFGGGKQVKTVSEQHLEFSGRASDRHF